MAGIQQSFNSQIPHCPEILKSLTLIFIYMKRSQQLHRKFSHGSPGKRKKYEFIVEKGENGNYSVMKIICGSLRHNSRTYF